MPPTILPAVNQTTTQSLGREDHTVMHTKFYLIVFISFFLFFFGAVGYVIYNQVKKLNETSIRECEEKQSDVVGPLLSRKESVVGQGQKVVVIERRHKVRNSRLIQSEDYFKKTSRNSMDSATFFQIQGNDCVPFYMKYVSSAPNGLRYGELNTQKDGKNNEECLHQNIEQGRESSSLGNSRNYTSCHHAESVDYLEQINGFRGPYSKCFGIRALQNDMMISTGLSASKEKRKTLPGDFGCHYGYSPTNEVVFEGKQKYSYSCINTGAQLENRVKRVSSVSTQTSVENIPLQLTKASNAASTSSGPCRLLSITNMNTPSLNS